MRCLNSAQALRAVGPPFRGGPSKNLEKVDFLRRHMRDMLSSQRANDCSPFKNASVYDGDHAEKRDNLANKVATSDRWLSISRIAFFKYIRPEIVSPHIASRNWIPLRIIHRSFDQPIKSRIKRCKVDWIVRLIRLSRAVEDRCQARDQASHNLSCILSRWRERLPAPEIQRIEQKRRSRASRHNV